MRETPPENSGPAGGVVRAAGRWFQSILGAEIRPGEGRLVALLFVDLFLLLTAYYILKVIREPLMLLSGGAVERQYARGFEAGLLLFVVPAYGLLAGRVDPSRLVGGVLAFFAACLVTFRVLAAFQVPIGFPFFVWLGIFSTLTIAQFWSLANDLYSEDEGKRLFPLVALGGTVGAIAGAQIAARLVTVLGAPNLMLVGGLLLIACVALTAVIRSRVASGGRTAAPLAREARHGGFRLVLTDRYLRLVAVCVFALNVINTTGDFVLARIVQEEASAFDGPAAREAFVTGFYGDFQTAITVLTAALQALVVARVFKRVGIGGAVCILPVMVLIGYGSVWFFPALFMARWVKILENAGDYSLQNTTQHALFLRTSRDAKYKAKAAIDTFVVRFGDLGSVLLVYVGIQVGWGPRSFAAANAVVAVAWLAAALMLARTWRARRDQAEAPPGGPA